MSGSTDGIAQFTAKVSGQPTSLNVQFNPASLKVSLTNTIKDDQPGAKTSQSVSKSSAKLEMELFFDSTDTGANVQDTSKQLRTMGQSPTLQNPSLPSVTFRWGLFSFLGVIETFQETLDFFSSAGVPLRSTVQLTMQQLPVESSAPASSSQDGSKTVVAPGKSAQDVAQRGGNSGAGRALATANGLDSMRFSAGAGLAVGGGVQLGGPVGFAASAGAGVSASAGFGASASAGFGASASAGFGASASAGFGASASAGFGASASAGFGASASAGFGASASAGFGASASAGFGTSTSTGFGTSTSSGFGTSTSAGFSASAYAGISGSASAGVSASDGAFAGLGVSKSMSATAQLNPDLLRPQVTTFSVSSSSGGFDVTGRAITTQSSGLRADVGGVPIATATLRIT